MAEQLETKIGAPAPPDQPAGPETPPATVSAPPSANGAAPAAAPPSPARARRRNLQRFLIPILLVAVLVAGVVGVYYYFNNLWYVSTDNAQVTGTPVPVGSLNAGRIESIEVQVGSLVHKGEVLARVVLPTTVSSAAVREGVVAPFDGVVIAIPVGVGATVEPGQGIATIVDPNGLYVNANIDETQVKRVAIGQQVDVHLDALNANVTGQVASITPASAATFSLLPQQNSSGTFTKVTQLVPVKIDLDIGSQPLLVGTSAEVKIHVDGR